MSISEGCEVEYTETSRAGKKRTIRGVVVQTHPAVLLDIRDGTRRKATRFVIRDARGKLHVTSAMAPTEPERTSDTASTLVPS